MIFGSGESDYLSIAKAAINGVFEAADEWTVDMLIYPTTTNSWAVINGGPDAANPVIGWGISAGTQLKEYYSSFISVNTVLSDAATIAVNTWQHIRVEKWLDGAQWKASFYIDGTPQYTINVSALALYTGDDFTLGYSADSARFFIGKINLFRVLNIASARGQAFVAPSHD